MKKLFLAVASVILTLALFTGCSTKAGLTLSGSYFLNDPTNLSVGQINETSIYNVSFTAKEDSAVKLNLTSGTYTTHLKNSEYEGTTCYEYSTVLDTAGSFTIDGNEQAFTDKIETWAYFLGVDNNLKPLYSKRTVKAHSVVPTSEKYSVEYYEYVLETKYENDTAVVNFTPNTQTSTGHYDLASGEHKFDKLSEKPYFDNEMMLIAMRAMDLNASFTAKFTTIDALSNAKRELELLPNAETPSETLEISYTNSGEKINKVETFKYGLAISGTFTGSSIILNYAGRTQAKEGQRLVRMQVEAPLQMGTFTYTITSVSKR